MALPFLKKKLPKILIRYGKLLDPIFIFYCKNNPELKARGWNDWTPPNQEEVLRRIEEYRKEWSSYEQPIMNGICSALGLNFKRNAIDVYIVSGNPRQLSNPIVIKSGFSPSEFVDSLTHELIHFLFQDNGKEVPIAILDKMFPNETISTQNHVIIQAVLKHIYLDVLKEEQRLERNIEISRQGDGNRDYLRAWEIVESRGYMKLIKEFKERIK